MRGRKENLTGQTFGVLTVLRRVDGKYTPYEVSCSACGQSKVMTSGNIKRGAQSCGCLHDMLTGLAHRKHGAVGTPEYYSWAGMKKRCYIPTDAAYPSYGARGITMCEEWRSDFLRFLEDMGPKPSPRHSIDRIDNDKGYSPDNCRWATKIEQANNRRLRHDWATCTQKMRDAKVVKRLAYLHSEAT